jgi:glycosyltransferase involved in cell wall biosynthesis
MPDGSSWPLVTIVTPSFNQADFLEETIRSVLFQGYPNLEYIIMDGGSQDDSVEIIKKYSHWLSYWTSKPDEGQSDAINSGFQRARGEYIAWLNSDDLFLPGAIQSIVLALHQNPQAGMAFGQTEVIDSMGHKLGIFEPVKYSFQNLLCMKIILPQQAAFFRRSVLERIGYLQKDLHYAMDVELFIRIGASYPILPVSTTSGQFRLSDINKGVISKTNWCPEFIKIIDEFFISDTLSQKYGHLRKAAYAGAYYRGAHTYFETGQYGQARAWLFQAAQNHFKYYLKPGWWKCLVLTLLGKQNNQVIQRILIELRRRNLYVNETDWQTGLSVSQADESLNR